MGTPNREPQEYSRNIIEYEDPGSYFPIIFLLYSWGSCLGFPLTIKCSKGSLKLAQVRDCVPTALIKFYMYSPS